MTIFLGCGFAAKYREGGGNFSVPLQWMLGLRRLKLDAIWLELLPATNDPHADQAGIDNFQRRLREHGLGGRYCLLYQKPASDAHDLDGMRCIGMSRRALLDRLAGSNALLNLSYSIHPPFLLQFERRIFCDLDLPKQIPEACFELAMNINADDPERARLTKRGWHIVDPHRVARTPGSYRRYMAGALGAVTAIRGVDVFDSAKNLRRILAV